MIASGSRKSVLVTDAGRASALAIIRSLGRSGWRVVAADAAAGLGFRSRYAHDCCLYPPPESAPHEFVEAISRLIQEQKIDLVIPVTDAALLPLSQHRERIEGLARLAIPDPVALEAVTNKFKTLELAERLAVPAPRTFLVHTAAEAHARAGLLGWPIVLKPQASRMSHRDGGSQRCEVCYADNQDVLLDRMRRFEGRCPVLLQEYYTGRAEGVELLMHQGRPLAAFQHRRIREIPVSGGASSFRVSIPLDSILYEHSVRLLGELRWTGLAMVEFKVGSAGPKLMEINGRVWGSLPLAVASGMDFPARLAELYMKGPPPAENGPVTAYLVGTRSRNLELDLTWIGAVLLGRKRYPFLPSPRRREAAAALLGLLNPRAKFDVMCLDDPWPALVEVSNVFSKLRRKLKSRD